MVVKKNVCINERIFDKHYINQKENYIYQAVYERLIIQNIHSGEMCQDSSGLLAGRQWLEIRCAKMVLFLVRTLESK